MTRPPVTHRLATAALALLLLAAVAGPALAKEKKKPKPPRVPAVAPVADSVTVGLWRFDETLGLQAADSGPFRLSGVAGPDTRAAFGRFRNGREFPAAAQAFVVVPYNPVLDLEHRFTIEAWVYVNAVSDGTLQTIAARWSPLVNEQLWAFGVSGRALDSATLGNPYADLLNGAPPLRLVFAYRSGQSTQTQTIVSVGELPLERWVHVAATIDGEVATLYVEGRLDSQVAMPYAMRTGPVPLMFGNTLDSHRMTDFGGDLRVDTIGQRFKGDPLDGLLDEVRLSSAARTTFESAPPR